MDSVCSQSGDLVGFSAVHDAELSFFQQVLLQVDLHKVISFYNMKNFHIVMPVPFYKEMFRPGSSFSCCKMQDTDRMLPGAVDDILFQGQIGIHGKTPFCNIL